MAHCPASPGRPRFEIADLVRAHRLELEQKHFLTRAQRRVLSAIALCRTVALGGHLEVCRQCGFEQPAYNSCRNRHCPKCQALAQEKWIAARSERVLPIGHFHVVFTLPSELRALNREQILDAGVHVRGQFQRFDPFQDPEAFDRLTARLAHLRWRVYAKRPFRRPEHLLGYLGRYTHRIAIANSRLVDVQQDAVTFRTKNGKTETLHPVEFLRRFLQHVLPDGFKKIRHFGLFASSHRDELEAARCQMSPRFSCVPAPFSWSEQLRILTGRDVTRCPHCGAQLERIPLLLRSARAPPQVAA